MTLIQNLTTAAIPGSLKIPSTSRGLIKSLSRLSRDSLIDLALHWLNNVANPAFHPYLMSNRNLEEEVEEDYLYTPAESVEQLRDIYRKLKQENGTRREIIDRILDGDWRRGLSLQQLAIIDFCYLQENEASLRWTALKLVPLRNSDETDEEPVKKKRRKLNDEELYPQIQASTFLKSLHNEISPFVRAHYHIHQLPKPHNLTILRMHIADTPYSPPSRSAITNFTNAARTIYIALPDSCPYIYVSISGAYSSSAEIKARMDVAALKRVVLEAIPKALSRPQERYALQPTNLTTKSLSTICGLRGNGKTGASGGAYSIFIDEDCNSTPLDLEVAATVKRKILAERDSNVETAVSTTIAKRFGTVGLSNSNKQKIAFDRMHVNFQQQGGMKQGEESTKTVSITFLGSDILAGIRQLAELGRMDMHQMPAWMTGESGMTNMSIRDGKVLNDKGGGV